MVEVTYEPGLEQQLSDGVILRSDVWRPVGPGRHPTILIRQPYGRQTAEDITYAHPAWYARHGFAVISQDVRGRWGSGGAFTPFANEAADGAETIAQVAELPFSNGQVGMYGFSYGGATQLQAAARAPDALRAMVPALTSADFHEGWTYEHGALALAFTASWATNLAADVARRQGDGSGEAALLGQFGNSPALYGTLPLTDYPSLQSGAPGGFFQDWIAHEARDDYWTRWDVSAQLADITADALVVAGLYDIFLESSLRVFGGLRARSSAATSLLLAPWGHIPWSRHVGLLDFGDDAVSRVDERQLRLFSQTLRGDDVPDEAPVTAFVTGRNAWTTFESWPPDHESVRLWLHGTRANSAAGDGSLSADPPGDEPHDVFTYDPAYPVPSVGGHSCCFAHVSPIGPAPQQAVEEMTGVLVYSSAPLERDLLVAGSVGVQLWAATTAPDTDWVVRICDVDADGRSINIAETIQRARFHQGTDASRPIPAGEVVQFSLAASCCHLFAAGHRIRLHVTSSAFPAWDRNLNTGNPVGSEPIGARVVAIQSVYHDQAAPSCIDLPVLS